MVEAYKAYQYVALYSFGKSQNLLKRVLTPTLQMLLVLRLMSMMEATTLLSQFDKQGFPCFGLFD
jgi:hypothetical protein